MAASSLGHHVSTLWFEDDAVTNHPVTLHLVSQRLPQLRELDLTLRLTGAPLAFPAKLVKLTLSLEREDDSAHSFASLFNGAMTAVARLDQLEDLSLTVPDGQWTAGCSLAPLVRLLSLRALFFEFESILPLSDAQVGELRALGQLETIKLEPLDAPLLIRLLGPPHALRWQGLGRLPIITDTIASLLARLPLQTFDASYPGLRMPHCDWLAQMPQLTELTLRSSGLMPLDVDRILQAVSGCARLRILAFIDSMDSRGFHFTSAQLGICLPRLTKLQTFQLSFAAGLTTLAFLAEGSLPRTLTELRLRFFSQRLPVSELQHVFQLRTLRVLSLRNVFDTSLGEAGELPFKPPIQPLLMPHLENFEHKWTAPDAEDENE